MNLFKKVFFLQNSKLQILYSLTTHLLSIERADWPKLHAVFKARDPNTWQVGFPVEVCALNSLSNNIFLDAVACIESRCLSCWSVNSFDFVLEKLHSQ